MNGARTIFRRKGYLLTALAAAVLLAASSGTAYAQRNTERPVLSELKISIIGPRTVVEGEDAVITVRGTATVAPTVKMDEPQGEAGDATRDEYNDGHQSATRRVTVYLAASAGESTTATPGEFGMPGQVDDADIITNPAVTLTFAENTGSNSRERTVTGSVTVRTNADVDAENERVSVGLDLDVVLTDGNDGIGSPIDDDEPMVTAASFTIDDVETQTYVLTLNQVLHHSTNPPMEGKGIDVNIDAKPAHYQDGEDITLQLSKNGGRATGYGVMESVRVGVPVDAEDTETATAGKNRKGINISTPSGENGDGNRVTDTITLEAHSGRAGRDSLAGSIDIDVLDVNQLPAPSAITAVAKDKDGKVVTEIMEGGDPVFLTITVDRGKGASDRITEEDLTVDIDAANAGQVADYDLSESRIKFESRSSGKQTNDVDLEIELSARSDDDVSMEYLMLNLELSGDSDVGTETSTGTFSIGIVDNTVTKVAPKSEDDAYPAIMAAMKAGEGDDGFNPGESFSVMTSDLFDVADGYTAAYGVSVDGDSVSVSASSDSINIDAKSAGESKITITATAKMAGSSFIPEQTVADVARITFPVMVVDKPVVVEPEPEPSNTIVPKAQGDAYPVITGAIEAGAGDEGLNPGESFSVMASALFTVMDGYTAGYSASVDGDAASASVSGDSVTVTAAAAGAAKVTITGTSKMASSSFLPEQVATNVADITFEVMVVDKPLAALVVTLGMPANVMDGNIVEGESYDIVVSANRMVTEDTEVMIMRDRAASDAGEDDFTVSSATIMAGYDSATAELMVTEDMLPDSGTDDNMGESLVLYGMVDGEETNSLTFTIWDTAVPALPLFGQLLLALFLMLGGARLYRRRQG